MRMFRKATGRGHGAATKAERLVGCAASAACLEPTGRLFFIIFACYTRASSKFLGGENRLSDYICGRDIGEITMYTKKIQIDNYGPIDHLDITFPFDGDAPKPVVLVGENGSGKSILLSHIVNGLVSAQSYIYPGAPEVEAGKVYKLRSPLYIRSGKEYSYGRVDFEGNLYCEELVLNRLKKDLPAELLSNEANKLWGKMPDSEHSNMGNNFNDPAQEQLLKDVFSKNCVLYFPPNRFEEPAWLNEENLKAKAEYMNLKHLQGYTDRKIINYSPLHYNQNWLFDVIYDRAVFEIQTRQSVPVTIQGNISTTLPLFLGYSGKAASTYDIALEIVRSIINRSQSIRFGIGRRLSRFVSIVESEETLVPNIFQLSSGETSLLNLFLSILRDFDLCGASFAKTEEIRGIVIVDEIDLHLHSIHQYEILPHLVKMFPRVQFIVTTHSPLFVLGLGKTFGEAGFALYRLPQGEQISPEEFSEFGSAYKSLTETGKFLDDVQKAIKESQKPVVFMDGVTDVTYLRKAAEWLGKQAILETVELRDGGGSGELDKILKSSEGLDKLWKKFDSKLSEIIPQKVILLHDCDKPGHGTEGKVFKRNIPKQQTHPVQKGIENLFEKATLEEARKVKRAFIDITAEHKETVRGAEKTVPEKWEVNKHEKTNLCNWLCENGMAEDFKHFQVIFDLLEEILTDDRETTTAVSAGQSH